jgi:hypothetical protein
LTWPSESFERGASSRSTLKTHSVNSSNKRLVLHVYQFELLVRIPYVHRVNRLHPAVEFQAREVPKSWLVHPVLEVVERMLVAGS